MKNPYHILGLPNCASMEDIKKAYRGLALKFHPDRGGDQEKMKEINEAYSYLVKNKEQYDLTLKPRMPSNKGGFTIFVGGFQAGWDFDNSNSFTAYGRTVSTSTGRW